MSKIQGLTTILSWCWISSPSADFPELSPKRLSHCFFRAESHSVYALQQGRGRSHVFPVTLTGEQVRAARLADCPTWGDASGGLFLWGHSVSSCPCIPCELEVRQKVWRLLFLFLFFRAGRRILRECCLFRASFLATGASLILSKVAKNSDCIVSF